MPGPDMEQQRRRDEDEAWQPTQKSSLWPFVATIIAAFAIRRIFSLKHPSVNPARQTFSARNETRSRESSRNTIRYTYWTYDGRKKEGYVWRESVRMDDPWSRIWKDGFLDVEELERLERIRRMQETFHRTRASSARPYETWQESGSTSSENNDQAWREDWTWGRANWEQWRNAQSQSEKSSQRSAQASHYENLGLDPSKAGTYSQDDLKAAFRTKAMEYHPDRNQHRKEFAESKFREMLSSYEALKTK